MRSQFLDEFLGADRPTRQRFVAELLERIKNRLENIDLFIDNADAAPKGAAALFAEATQRAKNDRSDILAILQALVEPGDWAEAIQDALEFRRNREAQRRRAAKSAKPKPGRPANFEAIAQRMLTEVSNQTVTLAGLMEMRQEQLAERYSTSRGTARKALDAVKKIARVGELSETVKNSVVELRPTQLRGNPR